MAKITFYPLGNADTSLVEFSDGRLLLKDYFCPSADSRPKGDKRAIMSEELDEVLKEKGRDYIDAVAFSHRDCDHVEGAEKYFKMEHAPDKKEYGSIMMNELWVPSYFIIETNLECESARIIQKEARHRMKEGKNIKVIGRSEILDQWISKNIGESRDDLIFEAGRCLDVFISKDKGGAQIFIHAPFSAETDDDSCKPNDSSMVLHITFFEGDNTTKVMMGSDAKAKVWDKLIEITNAKGNQDRLEWDIFRISHHCSSGALNEEEKGKDKTNPYDNIKDMFDAGDGHSYLISSSKLIPENDDDDQPPHRQAANYYKSLCGTFSVTMDEPSRQTPKPMIFEITKFGHRRSISTASSIIPAVVSRPSGKQG